MTADLRWLLLLGVPIENIAKRIGRTPTAVRNEIKNDDNEMSADK